MRLTVYSAWSPFAACALSLAFAAGCSKADDDSGRNEPPTTTPVSDLPAPGSGGLAKPTGAPGELTVLNWAGFSSAVSYTFDDANSSQIQHYPELKALGVRMTFYLWTGRTEAKDPIWAQAHSDGHELGNHTVSHVHEGTPAEVDDATTFIQDTFKTKVWTMAAPFGDAVYSELAPGRFFINRGVSNGLIAPNDNSDPFTLYCYIPPQDATADVLNQQIDSAQAAHSWRVVLVHGFTGGTDSAYLPVAIDQFVASVEHAKSLGDVWIDSVVNVGAYWQGQKAFTQAEKTTSGDTTTWVWHLPDRFPTGKYLRVNVAGGTLEQDGKKLPWDDHGYYEVSLDASSLTLRP